mmetsp:Transcript_3143/g.5536  ORF Transcript_3143/g.5536 Transcript_3143/m.5536 type:complete len:80 (-) Transcript_3143:123-362(-)
MLNGMLCRVDAEASHAAGQESPKQPFRLKGTPNPGGRMWFPGEGALCHVDDKGKKSSQDSGLDFVAQRHNTEGVHVCRT